MKLSWGTISMGTICVLFGLFDLFNTIRILMINLDNPDIPLLASLSEFFLFFMLGLLLTTSGILTFRLHPWAPLMAIVWASIVQSWILVNFVPPAWEYLTYDHPEGVRVQWGATIGGILGSLTFPSILYVFYSRPKTKQYFGIKGEEREDSTLPVSLSKFLTWNLAVWTLCIFAILWMASQDIFEAALMVLLVIVLLGLFEFISHPGEKS